MGSLMGMSDKAQATWGGRFSKGPADLMLAFSESVSFDKRLAPYDLDVNRAHTSMLNKIGLLSDQELKEIHEGLETLRLQIDSGVFEWKPELEDVHMNIEQALTELTPAAAKMHTARSRNDQVATDARLFFKDACSRLLEKLKRASRALLSLAESSQNVFIPGYTHLQRAQPVSAAHHLLAYVEMLGRDIGRFESVADSANWCPLGCGAIAGTTLPIDREHTARALGFVDAQGVARVTRNSMDSVSDRDLFLDFAQACSVCSMHLSRFAEDLILWNSSEFGYISLPDAFCTGSSLMPQKKNPDSLEILRGKSGRMLGNLQALYVMTKGLPLTYNRDLQEDKPPVFDSFDQLAISLDVVVGTVAGAEFRQGPCSRAAGDPALLATDLADYLVLKGLAFREAHHVVGALVALGEKLDCQIDEVPDDEARSLHDKMGPDWREVFELGRAMRSREGFGMPGPAQVAAQLVYWKERLA